MHFLQKYFLIRFLVFAVSVFIIFSNRAQASEFCTKLVADELKIIDSNNFQKLSAAKKSLVRTMSRSLRRLDEYLQKQTHDPDQGLHKLTWDNHGQATLHISYLDLKTGLTFMKLVYAAVSDGSLNNIDTSRIVGPKAVIGLLSLLDFAEEKGLNLKLTGSIDVSEVFSRFQWAEENFELEKHRQGYKSTDWGLNQILDFKHAFKEFEIQKYCRKYFGSANLKRCGELDFKIQTNDRLETQIEFWPGPSSLTERD